MFWCQREVGKNLNGHSVDELKSEKQFSHLESLVAVLGRGVHDKGVLDAGHDPQRDVGRAAVREGVPVRNVEPAGGRPLPHLESYHILCRNGGYLGKGASINDVRENFGFFDNL